MWFIKTKEKKKIEITKENAEYISIIKTLKAKIAEIEYLEFKNKRREAVRKFYEAAKLYCYETLKELQKKEKEKKKG